MRSCDCDLVWLLAGIVNAALKSMLWVKVWLLDEYCQHGAQKYAMQNVEQAETEARQSVPEHKAQCREQAELYV